MDGTLPPEKSSKSKSPKVRWWPICLGRNDSALLATQRQQPDFNLLGINIGQLSPSMQFVCCASGVYAFLLVYGYLQEKIVVDRFDRSFGMFLTLLQFSAYTGLSFIFRMVQGDFKRKIPVKDYVLLALLQACVQGLTNLSMKYLNYPAKVMFKSSRVVATVVVGSLVQKKRYPIKDWIVVLLLLMGLATFMNAEIIASPHFDLRGVGLILVALGCDAIVLNLQDDLLKTYEAHQDEVIFFSFLGSSMILLVINLVTGEFFRGSKYVLHHGGAKVFFEVFVFSAAGYLGLSCTTAITKLSGALISSITTTSRKAFTLMLSFLLFPKPIVSQHVIGALFFFSGLALKAWKKRQPERSLSPSSAKPHHSSPASLAVFQQPFQDTERGLHAVDEDEQEVSHAPLIRKADSAPELVHAFPFDTVVDALSDAEEDRRSFSLISKRRAVFNSDPSAPPSLAS